MPPWPSVWAHTDGQGGILTGHRLCYNCEEVIAGNDVYYDEDGNIYCERCFSELFTYCYECDNLIRTSDAIYVNDYSYCQTCVDTMWEEEVIFECAQCNGLYFRDRGCIEYEGESYCPTCAGYMGLAYCKKCFKVTDDLVIVRGFHNNSFCVECAQNDQTIIVYNGRYYRKPYFITTPFFYDEVINCNKQLIKDVVKDIWPMDIVEFVKRCLENVFYPLPVTAREVLQVVYRIGKLAGVTFTNLPCTLNLKKEDVVCLPKDVLEYIPILHVYY